MTNTFVSCQTRPAASAATSQDDAQSILAAQRLNRPISPHLTVYKIQMTSSLSILHRATGGFVSGVFYAFGAAYLVAPIFGWHLETASLAAAFGALPVAAKLLAKTVAALPFTYHCVNGIRHLVWDTGAMMTNQQVINTGYAMLAATTVGTLALVLM